MNKMDEYFNSMKDTIEKSLKDSDLERINYLLSKINDNTLITGVGGSSVVSSYASKVLNQKNRILTSNMQPRDMLYFNLNGYKNVLACSYSGNNYGVEMSFDNDLKHYLLTGSDVLDKSITTIKYDMNPEKSFISLGATLVPCSILLNYYLGSCDFITDMIRNYDFSFDTDCEIYEIFTGLDTSTLSTYLVSTMIEAGIGIPIIHDKYNYCHGRSTLCTTKKSNAIYFNRNTEFDKLMYEELPKYYNEVIKIDVSSGLQGEYESLIEIMYLTRYLSEKVGKDLSKVNYNPIVKKLYKFNGEI